METESPPLFGARNKDELGADGGLLGIRVPAVGPKKGVPEALCAHYSTWLSLFSFERGGPSSAAKRNNFSPSTRIERQVLREARSLRPASFPAFFRPENSETVSRLTVVEHGTFASKPCH